MLQKWLKWLSSRMLHGRYSLYFPSLHSGLLMAKDFKASKLWLFMFLSFPLLCHGFQITLLKLGLLYQKAIKTPKLNTIWLELIARVLNMLIGLKGNNFYSKVFKRVNYKLSNSTFWVVINDLDLLMSSIALSSWPKVVHVNHNLEVFIVSWAVSSRSRFVHVIHSLELMTQSHSYHPIAISNS